jgi:hypothetical protein
MNNKIKKKKVCEEELLTEEIYEVREINFLSVVLCNWANHNGHKYDPCNPEAEMCSMSISFH